MVLLFVLATLPTQGLKAHPLLQSVDTDAAQARIAEIKATAPGWTERFRENGGRWNIDSDDEIARSIEIGALHIALTPEQTVAWSLGDATASDFYAEVDAFHVGGPLNNEFGLAFRFVDDNNFYLFAGSSDGYYSLQKLVDGEWETLTEWVQSEAINTGETSVNTLGVLAEGEHISVLINGQVLESIEDSSFTTGRLALVVGSFDAGKVEMAFDDLSVWPLDEGVDEPVQKATEEPIEEEATPTVTPEPVDVAEQLEVIRAEEPQLSDDFRRDNGDWSAESDDKVTYSYVSRAYHVRVDQANWLGFAFNQRLLEESASSFLVEVDVTHVDGPLDAEYGLLFHHQDADNFYLYAISGEGAYSLWKKVDSEWTTLIEWTENTAINIEHGEANRLGLLVEGATVTLLVNDQVLTQIKEVALFLGDVGLVAGAFDEPGVEIAFDNFDFWPLAAAPADDHTLAPVSTPTPVDVSVRLQEVKETDPDFSDDFRRDNGVWSNESDERATYAVERRAYQVEIAEENWIGWSFPQPAIDLAPADFLVEVDVDHVAGPLNGEAGLVFRFVDEKNFYLFAANHDGQYILQKQVGGEWQTIVDWTTTDELVSGEGASNRMGVLAEGATLTLLINDRAITQLEDESFTAGSIGLAAGTFADAGLQVAFDNFDLWVFSSSSDGNGGDSPAVNVPDQEAVAQRLAAIKENAPVFEDAFRRDTGNWVQPDYEGVTFDYRRGEYHITVEKPQITPGSSGNVTVSDFLVEVNAAQIAGPIGQYGLFFREVDNRNAYLYVISPSQSFSLWKMEAGEWSALIEWSKAEAILGEEGDVNRLGVLAEGNQITLLVNDVPLAQIEDAAFAEGTVALAAGTFDEGGIEVAFDNLALWEVQ
jgi:hypothetical protein